MTAIILEFELAEGVSGDAVATELQTRLAALNEVEQVETQADEPRGVAEIMLIVSAGVVLLNQGATAAVALKNFVRAVKELMFEMGDFKRAFITLRDRKIDLATVTEKDFEDLG
jgi:hypothetical protein